MHIRNCATFNGEISIASIRVYLLSPRSSRRWSALSQIEVVATWLQYCLLKGSLILQIQIFSKIVSKIGFKLYNILVCVLYEYRASRSQKMSQKMVSKLVSDIVSNMVSTMVSKLVAKMVSKMISRMVSTTNLKNGFKNGLKHCLTNGLITWSQTWFQIWSQKMVPTKLEWFTITRTV